jgi:hypothetical protein
MSVFHYYELIDVQWPLHPSLASVPGGEGQHTGKPPAQDAGRHDPNLPHQYDA